MGGTALAWFRSYLSERTQSVIVRDITSSPRTLLYGVPQGSFLGPLLFSLYIAPLEDVVKAHGLDLMMYADDLQLYLTISSRDGQLTALSKLEMCIKDILVRCAMNKLSCNPSKTEVVHSSSRFSPNVSPTPPLSVGGSLVTPVPVARDLGVAMDSNLKMTHHINNVSKSASYAIRNIGRIHKYLVKEDCEKLIHAFVTSRLDCCDSILYGLPMSELNKLQRLQNTAARLVTKVKKTDHITPVLLNLHWLPVQSRKTYKILLLTYKALNGMASIYIYLNYYVFINHLGL